MSDTRNVTRNTAFLTAGSIGQKLLSFVYFTLVARLLGVQDTGAYLYALSFMNVFSVVIDFGLQPVLIREIARDKSQIRSIVSNALGMKVVLGALATGALLITSFFTETDSLRRELIMLSSIVMVFDSIHLTFYGVLRGYERLGFEAIGMLVGQVITIATGALVILFHLPLPFLMLSLACGSLWNVIYSAVQVARVSGQAPRFGFTAATWVRLGKLALPFALAAIFVKVYASSDSIILGKIAGNEAVAWYGVPYKFVFAFQFMPIALAAAIFPAMSRALAENKEKVVQIFVAAQRYLMLIVVPLVIGMIVLAQPLIMTFYGKNYAPSVLVMQVLALSLVWAFLDFPVGSLLNAARRQNVQTAWMFVTMVVNIILNFILIPKYGPYGSAVATVISSAILFFGGLAFIPSIIKVPWGRLARSFVRIGIASVAMGFAVRAINMRAPLALSVVVGVLTYVIGLFVTREIGVREFSKIREFVRPKKAVVMPIADLPISTDEKKVELV